MPRQSGFLHNPQGSVCSRNWTRMTQREALLCWRLQSLVSLLQRYECDTSRGLIHKTHDVLASTLYGQYTLDSNHSHALSTRLAYRNLPIHGFSILKLLGTWCVNCWILTFYHARCVLLLKLSRPSNSNIIQDVIE